MSPFGYNETIAADILPLSKPEVIALGFNRYDGAEQKKEYFAKPLRPAYDSFEASLKKANLALAELARQGSVKWIGHISFAGGALEKNNLHFSKLGTTSILLLRGGMLADIGSGLDEDTAEVDSHPIKTFSDISSGKVELGDRLVFTTSDLLEIFSFEEIRQNAARFSREEFPEIISASLTANSELSGAIVVSMVSEEEAEERPTQLFTARFTGVTARRFCAPPS